MADNIREDTPIPIPDGGTAGVDRIDRLKNKMVVVDSANQPPIPTTATFTLPVGQQTMAASLPVVVASNQSAIAVTIGSIPQLPAALVGGRLDVDLGAVGGAAFSQGQQLMAASLPVVIASNQTAVAISGAVTVTGGPVSVTAAQLPAALVGGRLDVDLGAVGGAAFSQGQQLMAASLPVVIASNQTALAVTCTGALTPAESTVNPTTAIGAASFLMGWNGASWDRVRVEGTNNDGETPLTNGALAVEAYPMEYNGATWDRALKVTQASGSALPSAAMVVGHSDGTNVRTPRVFDADTGAGTEYVGGAILRISASGGSIEAKGQQTMADSLPVTLASDQPAIKTAVAGAGTSSVTSVASSASSVTLLAANANRLGAGVFNDSSATLYLKLGSTASSSSFTFKMGQDYYFGIPWGYTGIVTGIWASATGNARVTEVTA